MLAQHSSSGTEQHLTTSVQFVKCRLQTLEGETMHTMQTKHRFDTFSANVFRK